MDGSGSVGESNFDLTKEFVANTIDAFQIGAIETRIGVIQYSSTVYPEIALGAENNLDELLNNIM